MNNYIVVGIIITIICIFIMNSDLVKMVMPNGKIFRSKSRMNKKSRNEKFDESDDSEIDYNIDTESKKSSKSCDETEISFDDSSDKSKIYNNKNMNKKFLTNIKKMMLKMKTDKNKRLDKRPKNDIQQMHKLAEELNRKKNNVRNDQSNKTIDNTNYDLTDTISGIIVNELNKM